MNDVIDKILQYIFPDRFFHDQIQLTLGFLASLAFSRLYQIYYMLNDSWINPFDIGHGPSNGLPILSQKDRRAYS